MDTVSVSSVEVSLQHESNTSQHQAISSDTATVSLHTNALTVMEEATGKSQLKSNEPLYFLPTLRYDSHMISTN